MRSGSRPCRAPEPDDDPPSDPRTGDGRGGQDATFFLVPHYSRGSIVSVLVLQRVLRVDAVRRQVRRAARSRARIGLAPPRPNWWRLRRWRSGRALALAWGIAVGSYFGVAIPEQTVLGRLVVFDTSTWMLG
jgi:hypothetical protein